MNFLIDANFPANVVPYLQQMYRQHTFDAVVHGDYDPGMDDIPLFSAAKANKVDVFITGDIAQIQGQDRKNERKACQDAGLHWLGVPQVLKARGTDKKWGQINSLLANLRFAIREFETAQTPQAILLTPGIHQLQCASGFPQEL